MFEGLVEMKLLIPSANYTKNHEKVTWLVTIVPQGIAGTVKLVC